MILTATNVQNFRLLAQCCYADKAVEYVEAVYLGDKSKAECLFEKMKVLYIGIEALCGFTGSEYIGDCVNFTFNYQAISDGDEWQLFVGNTAIMDKVTYSAADGIESFMLDWYNAINSNTAGFTATQTGEDSGNQEVYFTVCSPGLGFQGGDLTATSTGLADLTPSSTTLTAPTIECLTDTQVGKIIDTISDICNCPCECSPGEIINDTVPEYAQI